MSGISVFIKGVSGWGVAQCTVLAQSMWDPGFSLSGTKTNEQTHKVSAFCLPP